LEEIAMNICEFNKIKINELVKISRNAGDSPDKVQGGGGNTSVKLDERYMAVKASGFMLNQVTPDNGYVIVDYAKIKDFYNNVDLSSGKDLEKESQEFVNNNVVEVDGLKKLRPSVEAGFHSILRDYVMHTHSVYANILCCSCEGKAEAEKIFAGSEFKWIWIPYVNPGFTLIHHINETLKKAAEADGEIPEVIFMENHGLIVHADSSERCIKLHDTVNERIKSFYNPGDFPNVLLEPSGNGFISCTEFLSSFIVREKVYKSYFYRNALYPDQLVYINSNLESGNGKLNIDFARGEVIYNTNLNEATAMEETLTAYFYVIENVRKAGLTLKTMTEGQIAFIMNWDLEKYRKTVIGNGGK